MKSKTTKKKVKTFKLGDYVKADLGRKKFLIGVVIEVGENDEGYSWNLSRGQYRVGYIDDYDGSPCDQRFKAEKLTKTKAPQYVVAWSDEDHDPFMPFLTLKEAMKFKEARVKAKAVETRLYKLVS